MRIEIRLTRVLYEQVLKDLLRPHPHADERVGFLSAKLGSLGGKGMLVIFTNYFAVPDSNYMYDPEVGARINGASIRTVMQRILDTKEGAFHVHIHSFLSNGRLVFSRTDMQDLLHLITQTDRSYAARSFSRRRITGFSWLYLMTS